jgi:raffinose/stachyose/melibiose transport system substrate-binding protein
LPLEDVETSKAVAHRIAMGGWIKVKLTRVWTRAAATLVVAAVAVSACGSSTSTPASTSPATVAPTSAATPAPTTAEKVTITVTSWRTDDIKMWQEKIIPAWAAKHPNTEVKFAPVETNNYNAATDASMQGGTGADVIACQPFEVTRANVKKGYYVALDDLEGLKQFDKTRIDAWAVDGKQYCMPVAAIHGVLYYNKGIFKELGLSVPKTWADFLQVLQKVKDSGKYSPLANGSGEGWALSGAGIDQTGPNWWKGEEGRMGLINGTKKLTDADFVAAFKAWGDLRPFLPKGFESLKYGDQQQLFALGKAAVWITGSWEIGMATSNGVDAGVFAPPLAEAGSDLYVMVHPDLAFGVNAKGKHVDAAKEFANWLASDEFLTVYTNSLPGFFGMRNNPPAFTNPLAQAMMDIANKAKGWTPRLALDRLSAGNPSLEVEKQARLQDYWNKPSMTAMDICTQLQAVLDAGYKPSSN